MADQNFDDEADESFAALFEQSLETPAPSISPGDKVTGRVVQVGVKNVLLDLGGGVDGMIGVGELAEPGEPVLVKAGDQLEAYVVKISNRVAELARSLGKGVAAKAALEDAAHTGVPVEGTVTAVNKGGYVVEVAGERAFCPLGQMDVRRIDDPATMLGRKLLFRIAEWRGGKDIVLSRRALLEEEQAQKAAATRERLEVGARFSGTVSRVMDFGAFVDIGGIEGLVHASELAYGRVRPSEVVYEGQAVEVEVLKIEAPKDGKGERISLSMRALADDPFDETMDELPEGTIVEGKVSRVQPFGAFVEIVPGVEGLLHVSGFGRRIGHPSEVVREGDAIPVRIDRVERETRRISLSYVDPAELELELAEAGPDEVQQAEVKTETSRAVAPGGETQKRETKASSLSRLRAAKGDKGPGMQVRRGAAGTASASSQQPQGGAAAGGQQGADTSSAASPRPDGGGAAPRTSAQAAKAGGARILGHSEPRAVEAEAADAPAPPRPAGPPSVGTVLQVTVDKVETFGLFVSWEGGRGLVPISDLGVPRGADLRRSHPVGTEFRAAVMEVRPDGKIRLSKSGAELADERAEAEAWTRAQPKSGGKGLGTFADLLKDKLGGGK